MLRRGRSGGPPQQQEQPVDGHVEDVSLDQHGNEIPEENTPAGDSGAVATPVGNAGVQQGDAGGGATPQDQDGTSLVGTIPGIVTALQQLAHVQNEMLKTQTGMLATQNGILAERHAAPPPAPLPVVSADKFRKLGPMYFDGSEDPLTADEWLSNMEDNLYLSKYDPAGWVDLVKRQVNIGRSRLGTVIVNYAVDALKIHASSNHVSCNQNPSPACSEVINCILSL